VKPPAAAPTSTATAPFTSRARTSQALASFDCPAERPWRDQADAVATTRRAGAQRVTTSPGAIRDQADSFRPRPQGRIGVTLRV